MLMKNHTIIILLLSLLLCGCSDRVRVSGKVLYDDGEPVTRGGVTFTNDIIQATGRIQPDGTYVLGGQRERDGIVPGTYRITVMARSGGGMSGIPETLWVDEKYENPGTSGLSVEVTGRMTHDIIVTRPPGFVPPEPVQMGASGMPVHIEQMLERNRQMEEINRQRMQQQQQQQQQR